MGEVCTGPNTTLAPPALARWTRKPRRQRGAILTTDNTSALRGQAHFSGFAPTKAAQRILAETIARELGPRSVPVAYVVIDAVIDLSETRERWLAQPDPFFIKPSSIAEKIWPVVHQPRDAWLFNVELRPFGETW